MPPSPRFRAARRAAAAAIAVAAAAAACARQPEPPAPLGVALAASTGAVELTGLTREERAALDADPPAPAYWERLLRVSVQAAEAGGPAPPAVAGRYEVTGGGVRFTPAFPFEPGRRYDVSVDLARVRRDAPRVLTATIGLPGGAPPAATTRVVGISPGSDRVPENLLRLYVWFSAPMSRESGVPHARLFDDRGEVAGAFLPVDGGFWNHDFTRYTLFFDPGRVKEGILPHEKMGRPLVAGRRYRLAIARDWRDAQGAPLARAFEHRFTAVAAATQALDMAAWQVTLPRAGTRDPIVLRFPAALDHALALRAIGVETAGGSAIDGDVSLDAADTEWRLAPREPWRPGRYEIVALDALEDPAGNRLGRAFEVPIDDRAPAAAPRERFTRAFAVVAPS